MKQYQYKSIFKEADLKNLFDVFKQVNPKKIKISAWDEEKDDAFNKTITRDLDKMITKDKVNILSGKNLPTSKFKLVDPVEFPDYASSKDFTFVYAKNAPSLDDAIFLWFPKK